MTSDLYHRIKAQLLPLYSPGEASALTLLLMEKGLGVSRTDALCGKDMVFSPKTEAHLADMLAQLQRHVPIQYVLGEADFCGLPIGVGPGVLIPRPETEELVEWACHVADHLPSQRLRIIDCCTGSGCIALALATRLPLASVTGTDFSTTALDIARDNARRLGLRCEFVRDDVLNSRLDTQADLIVSNPPYICEEERRDMDDNVLLHEPPEALFVPDADPLVFYRALAALGQRTLKPGGWLMVEINRRFAPAVVNLLANDGYVEAESRKDSWGNDRMVAARKKG